MKTFFTIVFSMCLFIANAQELVGVTMGASYQDEVYYNLQTDEVSEVSFDEWNIAFTTAEGTAGVFLNEATPYQGVQQELYLTPASDFDDVIDPDDLEDRLFNAEITWEFGAFNEMRNEADSGDFGWGVLNESTDVIEGDKVFVLRFRSGDYIKLQIVSLENGIYTVKTANLDGSDENILTVNKNDFAGAPVAYYSIEDGAFLDKVQPEWDLLFVRYIQPLSDGSGGVQYYPLTGVLSGVGAEVAQANIVDPETVAFEDFQDSLKTEIDVIGHDWKEFDLANFEWVVNEFRAYFVKTAQGDVWKVVFKFFSGSSSGLIDFEKTLVGSVTAVEEQNNVRDFGVFPNPVATEANVAFTLEKASEINIQITDMNGRQVWSRSNLNGNTGFNMLTIPVLDLPTGTYFLSLYTADNVVTEKIVTD